MKMMEELRGVSGFDPDREDVESVFSLEEEPSPATVLALWQDDSEDSFDEEVQGLYRVSPDTKPTHPVPLV